MRLCEARFMLVLMAILLGIRQGVSAIEYMEAGRYYMVAICDVGLVMWLISAFMFYRLPWIIQTKETITLEISRD